MFRRQTQDGGLFHLMQQRVCRRQSGHRAQPSSHRASGLKGNPHQLKLEVLRVITANFGPKAFAKRPNNVLRPLTYIADYKPTGFWEQGQRKKSGFWSR